MIQLPEVELVMSDLKVNGEGASDNKTFVSGNVLITVNVKSNLGRSELFYMKLTGMNQIVLFLF